MNVLHSDRKKTLKISPFSLFSEFHDKSGESGIWEAGNSTHEIGRVGISGPVCLDIDSCLDSTRQKLGLIPAASAGAGAEIW